MSQLLDKGVQKLLSDALLPNQNMMPCVRYVGFKLWMSINHVRYQKNVHLCFVQVLLGTSKVGPTDWIYQLKDKQPNER